MQPVMRSERRYPVLAIRISADQLAELRDFSKEADMSMAAAIKHCIKIELPKLKKRYGLG